MSDVDGSLDYMDDLGLFSGKSAPFVRYDKPLSGPFGFHRDSRLSCESDNQTNFAPQQHGGSMTIQRTVEGLHARYDATERKIDRVGTWVVASGLTTVIVGVVLIAVFVFGFRLG